jgi:hypothetical protein
MGAGIVLASFRLPYYINIKHQQSEYYLRLNAMSYIVWSHRCRKCKGQFYLEQSEDGNFLVCIQCGYSEKVGDSELAALLAAIHPASKKNLTKV